MGKLEQENCYLHGCPKLLLVLETMGMNLVALWWTDALFGTHWDCKGQSHGIKSFGKGTVIDVSKMQNINTKISMELELVGIDEILLEMIWTNHFIQNQGYKPHATVLHQDNKSTIKLEVNRW